MKEISLNEIAQQLREFTDERDWDQFHSPKNLGMALVAEAGELAAEFQWMTEAESRAPDAAPHALSGRESDYPSATVLSSTGS